MTLLKLVFCLSSQLILQCLGSVWRHEEAFMYVPAGLSTRHLNPLSEQEDKHIYQWLQTAVGGWDIDAQWFSAEFIQVSD